MKTKFVLFLCLTVLFVFPTASQIITPRFTLGLGSAELEPTLYEIVASSVQVKAGGMWRINKWIKSTCQIGYSQFAAGSDRRWSSLSPQWELSFQKDSSHQRVVPFVSLARTKHFLRQNDNQSGKLEANQNRSNWVQYSLSIGARVAFNTRSGCYLQYNRLFINPYHYTLNRANGNVEVGYYRELRPKAKPSQEESFRRLTFFTSAGFGKYRTIWRDSVYSTENMYDVHLGLELNKGKRLSYFTSLGIRNGVGVTAGLEYSFSLKGSRRLGIRLGVQRKYTREKTLLPSIEEDQGIIFHPSSDAIDTRSEATGKSRGAVIDFNYSLSKNITFYVSYFETRFDFHLPSYGFDLLGNQEDGRYLIQNIQGVTIGFRAYLVKAK